MKIIIVNSQQDKTDDLRRILSIDFTGCEILEFQDPLLAIKYNQTFTADMIICNFTLRIIDGIQLIKLLRKQRDNILSVLVEPDDTHLRDAKNLGIYHFNAYPAAGVLLELWRENMLED